MCFTSCTLSSLNYFHRQPDWLVSFGVWSISDFLIGVTRSVYLSSQAVTKVWKSLTFRCGCTKAPWSCPQGLYPTVEKQFQVKGHFSTCRISVASYARMYLEFLEGWLCKAGQRRFTDTSPSQISDHLASVSVLKGADWGNFSAMTCTIDGALQH